MAEEQKGPQVNWVGAIGSGLGSVTSAILLSTTGAAGTWIGAGVGTFIITVGGAFYGYYLQRAKTGIEKTADKLNLPGAPATKAAKGSTKDTKQDTKSITAQRDPHDNTARSEAPPEDDSDKEQDKPRWKEALRNINWKRVAGWGLALFAVTMAIIFIFELVTGRPVSSYTGGSSPDSTGTSITGVYDPAEGEDPAQSPIQPGGDDEQPEDQEQLPDQEAPEEDEAPLPGLDDQEQPQDEAPPVEEPAPEIAPEQVPQHEQPQQQEGMEAPQQ